MCWEPNEKQEARNGKVELLSGKSHKVYCGQLYGTHFSAFLQTWSTIEMLSETLISLVKTPLDGEMFQEIAGSDKKRFIAYFNSIQSLPEI